MKVGIDAILASNTYGAPRLFLQGLMNSATQLGTAKFMRPVNKHAKSLLEAGAYTKPFTFKVKSLESGPGAAYTSPHEYRFKFKDKETIEEGKKRQAAAHVSEIATARKKDDEKNNGKLIEVDLYLTSERIQELSDMKALDVKKVDEETFSLSWKNGWERKGVARKGQDGKYQIFYIDENQQEKPFRVFARQDHEEINALTADLDIFYIAPQYRDFDPGFLDQTPHRMQSRQTVNTRASIQVQSREMSDKGNISQRMLEELDVINNCIASEDTSRAKVESKEDKKAESEGKPISLKGKWVMPNEYTLYLAEFKDEVMTLEILNQKGFNTPTLIKHKDKYYLYGYNYSANLLDEPTLTELKNVGAEEFKKNFIKGKIDIKRNDPLYIEIERVKAHLPLVKVQSNKPYQGREMRASKKVVWHNQELFNPFAEPPEKNLPLLAVLPPINNESKPEIYLAETPDDMKELFKEMLKRGFYFPTHPEYKHLFPAFRDIRKLADQNSKDVEFDLKKFDEEYSLTTIKQKLKHEFKELFENKKNVSKQITGAIKASVDREGASRHNKLLTSIYILDQLIEAKDKKGVDVKAFHDQYILLKARYDKYKKQKELGQPLLDKDGKAFLKRNIAYYKKFKDLYLGHLDKFSSKSTEKNLLKSTSANSTKRMFGEFKLKITEKLSQRQRVDSVSPLSLVSKSGNRSLSPTSPRSGGSLSPSSSFGSPRSVSSVTTSFSFTSTLSPASPLSPRPASGTFETEAPSSSASSSSSTAASTMSRSFSNKNSGTDTSS